MSFPTSSASRVHARRPAVANARRKRRRRPAVRNSPPHRQPEPPPRCRAQRREQPTGRNTATRQKPYRTAAGGERGAATTHARGDAAPPRRGGTYDSSRRTGCSGGTGIRPVTSPAERQSPSDRNTARDTTNPQRSQHPSLPKGRHRLHRLKAGVRFMKLKYVS